MIKTKRICDLCGKEIKKDDHWNEIIWHGPVQDIKINVCLKCWDDTLFKPKKQICEGERKCEEIKND